MYKLDHFLEDVNYYYNEYRKQERIKAPIPVLNSGKDLAFVSDQGDHSTVTPVNQLEFITEKFKEIAASVASEKGIKRIVRKISPNDYNSVMKELRYIEERTLQIARKEESWGQLFLGFAYDIISPTWNPITKAQFEIHEAIEKIEQCYKSESSSVLPKEIKDLEQKLHFDTIKASVKIEDLVNEYKQGTHSLDEFIETIKALDSILAPLKSSLKETVETMRESARDVTQADATTQLEIRKNLADLGSTVKSILAATRQNYGDLNDEIKELFLINDIEAPLRTTPDASKLRFLINAKFMKLNQLLTKIGPLIDRGSSEKIKFAINVSQMGQIIHNLMEMKKQIDTIGEPDEAEIARSFFETKSTIFDAELMIDSLHNHPRWAEMMSGNELTTPLTFQTDFWLFKDVKLKSMSEVKQFTEQLNLYRESFHEVWVNLKELSERLEKPQTKQSAERQHQKTSRTAKKPPERNVRKPVVINVKHRA